MERTPLSDRASLEIPGLVGEAGLHMSHDGIWKVAGVFEPGKTPKAGQTFSYNCTPRGEVVNLSIVQVAKSKYVKGMTELTCEEV